MEKEVSIFHFSYVEWCERREQKANFELINSKIPEN